MICLLMICALDTTIQSIDKHDIDPTGYVIRPVAICILLDLLPHDPFY